MPIIKKLFGENTQTTTIRVDKFFDKSRLDTLLINYYPSLSREYFKRKIKKKEIIINNRSAKTKPSTILHLYDEITMVTHKTFHEDDYWNGELIQLKYPKLIFEDSNYIISNKPPYMATHPTGRHVFHTLTTYYENKYEHTIHSVHRIDRETSGIIILAKNPKAASRITQLIEFEQAMTKCYFFIAHKNKINPNHKFPFFANERLETNSLRVTDIKPLVNIFPESSTQGKNAKTYFKLIESNNDYVLGLARLFTGRQHQIRAHMFHHGMPLVGDKLYLGGKDLFLRFKEATATIEDHRLMQISRHALHAMALKIPNEINLDKSKSHIYIAQLPDDLKEFINKYFEINIDNLIEKIEANILDLLNKDFN
jgi:23S rRNA pseudouridine1911/1915/1917 synthase